MKISEQKIQEILIKQSYMSQQEVDDALKQSVGRDFVDYLFETKKLTKALLGQAIAEFYKIKFVDLETKPISDEALLIIPEDFANQNLCVCFLQEKAKFSIATADPENIDSLDQSIKALIGPQKLEFFYAIDSDIQGVLIKLKPPLQERFDKIINDNQYSAPDILDEIIIDASEYKSSDIHFEPQVDDTVLLRFRIDGILTEVAKFPKIIYLKVLNRIKVLAQLQIDEHYTPQDGSIRIDTDKFVLDLRVSIVPTIEGEKVVVRVLSDYIKDLNIEDLGFDAEDIHILDEVLKKPYGMILTTGPTGSGKSTTLYALIKRIKTSRINITTIEDPVEYRIKGINQIQVDPGHDITFARGLRSIVRQDPNVILVGEIRDTETADIAVNAALTGHLLFSSFHANDVASTIPRLIDMDIEPFLLASTINLIIAQRLVRKICMNCRYSEDYTHKELSEITGEDMHEYFDESEVRLYKGKGCEKCGYSGFKGRVAILELIYINEEMQAAIVNSPSSKDIWNIARKNGTRSFFEHGLGKVRLGVTSLEELVRVAPILHEKLNKNGKATAPQAKK